MYGGLRCSTLCHVRVITYVRGLRCSTLCHVRVMTYVRGLRCSTLCHVSVGHVTYWGLGYSTFQRHHPLTCWDTESPGTTGRGVWRVNQ